MNSSLIVHHDYSLSYIYPLKITSLLKTAESLSSQQDNLIEQDPRKSFKVEMEKKGVLTVQWRELQIFKSHRYYTYRSLSFSLANTKLKSPICGWKKYLNDHSFNKHKKRSIAKCPEKEKKCKNRFGITKLKRIKIKMSIVNFNTPLFNKMYLNFEGVVWNLLSLIRAKCE